MTILAAAPASAINLRRLAVAATVGALCLTVFAAPSAQALGPTCFGQEPTIIGTPDDEVLLGTPGPDVIVGLGGADAIDGRGGNDLICADQDGSLVAPSAADMLRGGSGDDQLLGVPAADESARTISSGDAGDDAMVETTVTYESSPRAVTARLSRYDAETDEYHPGEAHGWGNDTLDTVTQARGSSFDDVLIGNDAGLNDEGECDVLGCDVLIGGRGDDELRGRAGFDKLIGGGGHDRLLGGRGSDTLAPGPGADDVRGGAGLADTLDYTTSSHAVEVDLADGVATGLGRDTIGSLDRVSGSRFGDVIRGDARANTISGYDGPDVIRGRAGDDALFGSGGRDRLYGGAGYDTAAGGFGTDLCRAEETPTCET
jgi:Ca2+-binding RTX toxin-like protein